MTGLNVEHCFVYKFKPVINFYISSPFRGGEHRAYTQERGGKHKGGVQKENDMSQYFLWVRESLFYGGWGGTEKPKGEEDVKRMSVHTCVYIYIYININIYIYIYIFVCVCAYIYLYM